MAMPSTLALVRRCCLPGCGATIAATRFDEERISRQARVLGALADETRMKIVRLLAQHEAVCVCELEGAFHLSQPTISHHLRTLREAGIVESVRRGTWVYYSLRREAVKDVVGDLVAVL